MTVRENVSLLLAHGHTLAQHYPLGMVYDEADLVRQRIDIAKVEHVEFTRIAVSMANPELAKKDQRAFQRDWAKTRRLLLRSDDD